jgi:hypothetical protein
MILLPPFFYIRELKIELPLNMIFKNISSKTIRNWADGKSSPRQKTENTAKSDIKNFIENFIQEASLNGDKIQKILFYVLEDLKVKEPPRWKNLFDSINLGENFYEKDKDIKLFPKTQALTLKFEKESLILIDLLKENKIDEFKKRFLNKNILPPAMMEPLIIDKEALKQSKNSRDIAESLILISGLDMPLYLLSSLEAELIIKMIKPPYKSGIKKILPSKNNNDESITTPLEKWFDLLKDKYGFKSLNEMAYAIPNDIDKEDKKRSLRRWRKDQRISDKMLFEFIKNIIQEKSDINDDDLFFYIFFHLISYRVAWFLNELFKGLFSIKCSNNELIYGFSDRYLFWYNYNLQEHMKD